MTITDRLKGHAVRVAYALRRKTEIDGVAQVRLSNAKGELKPRSEVLRAGSINGPGAMPLICDILVERDVAVQMRDGVTIYTDVFRPAGDAKAPAVVAWSPYGKSDPMYDLSRIPRERLSNLQKFEAPDPAYWVAHGYAVINPDIRGSGVSGGNLVQWGKQDGRDGYDLTEWVAAQDWCNGRVGFAGNSYLAISQWFIGAEAPPHLAALAPWEGSMDCYRHSIAPGGIPAPEFNMMSIFLKGKAWKDDWTRMIRREPLLGRFWRDKVAAVDQITLPVYVVSSYTNKVHTRGTIHSFNALPSDAKWLRIHNSHEWTDFYDRQDDLRRFFDRYLKGADNGWETTPRVRMAVLDPGGTDTVDRAEESFPPAGVRRVAWYADAATGALQRAAPAVEAKAAYAAENRDGRTTFTLHFDEATEIAGFMKLKLWVSATKGDDIDLFVQAIKLDRYGNEMPVLVHGAPYSGAYGAPYEWGNGQIRASHRKLDVGRSTPDQPFLAHDEVQPLRPGEVVPVEIELPPMAIRFAAGQQLRIVVSGHVLQQPEFTFLIPDRSVNRGDTMIHTGGRYDSHLLLPVKQAQW